MFNSLFTTKIKRFAYLAVLALVVSSTATFMIFTQRGMLSGTFTFSAVSMILSYSDLLIMYVAGLWGIVPAMVSYLLVFTDAAIYDINSAYTTSVYVFAMVGAYMMSNRKAYRHIWSTVLCGVIMNGMLGAVWEIIGTIAEGEGLGGLEWSSLLSNEVYVTGEVVFYCVTMFLFMRFAPTKLKRIFPMGVNYIEGDELVGFIRDYRFVHNSRISRKLTWIVVAQALLLGVAASSFAAALMPSVADEVLSDTASDMQNFFERKKPSDAPDVGERQDPSDSGTDEQDTSSETSGDEESKSIRKTQHSLRQSVVAQQRFIFNNAGAAFIMKLIMMILNMAIPLIVLETAAVQWLVARPITALANSLEGFSGADRIEQEKKLKALEGMRVKGHDEISQLYDSISDMAHQINENVDQILREAELEEEVRVAQRAKESQASFLNNVSHELRTPINAVLGLDEMIVRESREENIRQYANDIQSAGKSLLALVNDILDSSKLEEGKMEILPVEYELGSLINDIVNMIAVKAKDKGLEFKLDVDEHLPHILYGDEIRIKQVIVNILTNAVKYTMEGGFTLDLGFRKLTDDDIMLTCSVADTGIGIKEEDMDKLFSRFERIEESKNRSIEGTGLGMNIVQQLLGLMDSELHVESVYGEGSTFSFEVKQRVVSWDEMGDFVESYHRSLESAGEYRQQFTAPDALILVTDDTPMNLTVIRGLLKPTKIQIDTAESGFETLDMIRKKKYDLIFLDHRMPEMDGIETLQKMKELKDCINADTPVISLTANAISGARETYMGAGFVDYLSKPIDSVKLERMLMEYLPDDKIIMVEKKEAEHKEDLPVGADLSVTDVDVRDEAGDHDISDPALAEFAAIPGIMYQEALKNCSNEDVLKEAALDYSKDILKKADMIEQYADSKDYANYTVLVHALKSSSRLIGAMSLSDEAKYLEACGNGAASGDERAMAEIGRRTPMMLEVYRGYYEFMAPIFGLPAQDVIDSDERPVISDEKLREGIMCLKDLTEAFDFDSMECVTAMLDEYRMPEDFVSDYEKIKALIHDVDRAALMEKLNSL